jgi:nanoRNase/pAp phosphatase (c-di-AMP/oligoRNAs hydrolase)
VNERDAKFAEIARVLREHNKFAVLSHVRPDGDASAARWRSHCH